MRKREKKIAEDFLGLLERVHPEIKTALDRGNTGQALALLEQCQQGAIRLGELLERTEGEGCPTIGFLEDYCELVYQAFEAVRQGESEHGGGVCRSLKRQLIQVENSLKTDVRLSREMVFLPYKVSMWDSLESIWRAAEADPDCDAYVIPIPYYDKNPDGSFREMHYEGGEYPKDVPVVWYKDYDFAKRRPDAVFIHNPYDDANYITSVEPFFYAENLKQYTDKLIYVPYFVVPWSIGEHFVLTPGVIRADVVVTQSELIKKQYVNILNQQPNPGKRLAWNQKIAALGSPKTDKVLSQAGKRRDMPEQWKRKAENRRIVFFNTNVSLILKNGAHLTENLYRIVQIFQEYKSEFVLLWREHPLTMETLRSMRPQFLEGYLKIRREFLEHDWGILDDTPEPHLAMAASDGYYGAGGSLVTIYSATGKPMMLTAYDYPEGISRREITKEELYASLGRKTYYKEEHSNALRLFLENFEEIAGFREHRLEVIAARLANLDGTAGEKIYQHVLNEVGK